MEPTRESTATTEKPPSLPIPFEADYSETWSVQCLIFPSGNRKLGDIGLFLKEMIQDYFSAKKMEINLKYIDPSYMIRSVIAEPIDSMYCERLGNNAVHAAMAGKTKLIIGLVNNEFVHIPMKEAISRRKFVDPEGSLWRDAVEATQQPLSLKPTP